MREYYGFDDEDPIERTRIKQTNEFLKQNHKVVITIAGTEQVVDISGDKSIRQVVEEVLGVDQGHLSPIELYCSPLVSIPDAEVLESMEKFGDIETPSTVGCSNCLDSLWSPILRDSSTQSYLETNKYMDSSIHMWKYRNIVRDFFGGLQLYEQYAFQGIRALEVSGLSPWLVLMSFRSF